jgi:hypothetical protein
LNDSALVVVGLNVPKFDWETYLGLEYVLFHECISHCFAGFADVQPSDSFAEGWMDLVAFRAMESYLDGEDFGEAWSGPDLRDEFKRVGERRYLDRREDEDDSWEGRSEGNHAASRLFRLLNHLYTKGADTMLSPTDAFYDISFRINQADLNADERKTMVSAIHDGLGKQGASSEYNRGH